KYIIYSLNSNGFMEADTKETCSIMHTAENNVEHCINLLQNYENRGIRCKNIVNYLSFQLKHKKIYNNYLFSIFISHMDDIQKQNYSFFKSIDVNEIDFLFYLIFINNYYILFHVNCVV